MKRFLAILATVLIGIVASPFALIAILLVAGLALFLVSVIGGTIAIVITGLLPLAAAGAICVAAFLIVTRLLDRS